MKRELQAGMLRRQQLNADSARVERTQLLPRPLAWREPNCQHGFSMVDLAIVLTIVALIAVIAIPIFTKTMSALRASSDARNLASQLALTKMRAASGFTRSRLNCDTSARSCQPEICTSKGTSTCNTFSADGGPVLLSDGSSFGFGSITTPAGTQSTIQNTNQILFNSRSIPVDSTGAPTSDYALYVTNSVGEVYAVTVSATGRIAAWRYRNGSWYVL